MQTSIGGLKILRKHHKTVAGMTVLRQNGSHGFLLALLKPHGRVL